jgi:hypothetical protein
MKKKMAKSAPKKDPKNDFIDLTLAMFFDPDPVREHRGLVFVLTQPTAPCQSPVRYGARSNSLPDFAMR